MKCYALALGLLFTLPAAAQQESHPSTSISEKAGTIAALDEKNGFRAYKFGAPVSAYPDLQKRANYYINPLETNKIGDVNIGNLRFVAFEGKLSGILFTTSGADNCHKLLEILRAQYGEPQQADYLRKGWIGSIASLIYEEKTVAGAYGTAYTSATVYLLSNALAEEQKAASVDKAKKAAATGL